MSDAELEPEVFTFQDAVKCQNCVRGEQSLAFCHDCKRYLCNDCHHQHSVLVDYAQHKTVESPEAEEIRRMYECSTHKGQPLNFYCDACSKPICDHCHRTLCSGHELMVEKDVKEGISTQLEKVKEKKKEFDNHKEYITSHSQQHENAIAVCEGEVDRAIDKLIKQLQQQKELFHEQLKEEAARVKELDDIQLQYVEEKIGKLQQGINDTEKLLESKTAKIMVDRDPTLQHLEAVALYSWSKSSVIPLGWQLKHKPTEEYASKFGKLIPKPRGEDIAVEGLSPNTNPRVGFTNDFTIIVNPAHQYKAHPVIKEVFVKIKQKPYQRRGREEEIMHVIKELNETCNKWTVSYFLRTHGEISVEVSVCSIAAAGSPFKLKTVERETIEVGMKVVRGRDWKYETQDGGEGSVGKVVEVKKDGWVMVKWPTQKKPHDYRWGHGDHYDLKVVD